MEKYHVALVGKPDGEVFDRWGASFHAGQEEAEKTMASVRAVLEAETGCPFLAGGIWSFETEKEAYAFLAYRLGIPEKEALDASIDAKAWAFRPPDRRVRHGEYGEGIRAGDCLEEKQVSGPCPRCGILTITTIQQWIARYDGDEGGRRVSVTPPHFKVCEGRASNYATDA